MLGEDLIAASHNSRRRSSPSRLRGVVLAMLSSESAETVPPSILMT